MKTFLELVDLIAQWRLPLAWDPAAWVGFHARVPLWAAGALVGAGLIVWMFGSRRPLFRFVLAVPFACLGLLFGPSLAAATPSLPPAVVTHGLAAGLALLSILLPSVVLFLSFGFLAGLGLGTVVAARGHEFAWGFLPGFFVIGSVALAVKPFTMRLVSGVVGSAMLGLGMLKLLALTPLAKLATASPIFDVALVAALTVLSVMYQSRYAPSGGKRKGRGKGGGRVDFEPPQRKT